MTPNPSAADLLRAVGLLPDGPVVWGRPLPPTGAGVFIVELAGPRPTAPLELTRIGKWVERVPDFRLDGERPTSKAVAARLAAFWLPSQPVIYIGASETSVSRRVAAIGNTVLGDRRPYSGGHWLHALAMPAGARVWWAATSAVEEYEDALLAEFAAAVPDAERAALPDRDVVLPFANLRQSTGERKSTGLTGTLLPEPVEPPRPPTRVVVVPDGDAEGADGSPPPKRARPAAKAAPARRPAGAGGGVGTPAPTPHLAPPVDGALTVEGAARMRTELETLTTTRRPEVIARIRAAKELGDLKENADYSSAREEQSFLEGRIQALEARLRTAVIVDAPVAGARIGLGSAVSVSIDGDEQVLTIVGSSESDPTTGRISSASPVGRALLGREAGDEVHVATPAGQLIFRVVSVD